MPPASLLPIVAIQQSLQGAETRRPQSLVLAEVSLGGLDRFGRKADNPLPSARAFPHETGLFEYADVLRNRSQRHRIGPGQFADGLLGLAQALQDVPSGRIRKGVKDQIEGI
jgi:hypothetical protein